MLAATDALRSIKDALAGLRGTFVVSRSLDGGFCIRGDAGDVLLAIEYAVFRCKLSRVAVLLCALHVISPLIFSFQ